MGELTAEPSESPVVIFETRQDPNLTLRRCNKFAVACGLVAAFLGITTYAIPVYLKGDIIDPTAGTDVITSVIAGAALRLDCGSLSHTAGKLVQVTWRKDMVMFYQQYSSGGRYRGHETGELGVHLRERLQSYAVGQITLFPALPGDAGTYLCEVARVSDEAAGTVVLRKSFGVSVVTGPQINLVLAGQMFTGAFTAVVLVFGAVRLAQRCRKHQTLEIITEPKPEEIADEDEVILLKSSHSSSRSNRSRPLSVRRRSGSNRSSPKASSSRMARGDDSATPVSRRSECASPDSRSRHRSRSSTGIGGADNFASTPHKLRIIQSYTRGKTTQLGATHKKGPVRKSPRNKARQGHDARK